MEGRLGWCRGASSSNNWDLHAVVRFACGDADAKPPPQQQGSPSACGGLLPFTPLRSPSVGLDEEDDDTFAVRLLLRVHGGGDVSKAVIMIIWIKFCKNLILSWIRVLINLRNSLACSINMRGGIRDGLTPYTPPRKTLAVISSGSNSEALGVVLAHPHVTFHPYTCRLRRSVVIVAAVLIGYDHIKVAVETIIRR
jgi:hypothetical protein